MNFDRFRYFLITVEIIALVVVFAIGLGGKIFAGNKQSKEPSKDSVHEFIEIEGADDTDDATQGTETSASAADTASDTAQNAATASAANSTAGTQINSWDDLSESVREKLNNMTVEQMVAQVFITRPEEITGVDTFSEAGARTQAALETYPLGGVLLNDDNFNTSDNSDEMLATIQAFSNDIIGTDLYITVTDDTTTEGYSKLSDFAGTTSGVKVDTSMYDGDPDSVVSSFANGSDMICVGTNFVSCYDALLSAVNDQSIPLEKLNLSVGRILSAKGV